MWTASRREGVYQVCSIWSGLSAEETQDISSPVCDTNTTTDNPQVTQHFLLASCFVEMNFVKFVLSMSFILHGYIFVIILCSIHFQCDLLSILLGYTEESGTNGFTETVPCGEDSLSLPQPSSHPAAEEMVGCPAKPVEPTSELINNTPHHNDRHMDLFTSLFNDHYLNDLVDPCSLNSPLTELDQEWDYDWSSLLDDMYNTVSDPLCY